METLTIEMLEMIVQQLTPQDLARCSAVCRKWRDVFNQDWMWKPHCDPELDEPLRTIRCVTTPAFVAPEEEDSTLSPINHWKLAFMRENRLWENWKTLNCSKYIKENVIKFENNDPKSVDFLTDNLVVVWYSNSIQILDMSVLPGTLVAETSFDILRYDCCSVIGTSMLLVEKDESVIVFSVDIINPSIKLKHNIPLAHRTRLETHTKEHFYLCKDTNELKFTIFDLNTGKILKEVPCPVNNPCGYGGFGSITVSETSDFVAVVYPYGDQKLGYYIFSLQQLTFLPGPVAECPVNSEVALHGQWLAVVADKKTFKVYNFKSGEVVLSHDFNKEELGLHVSSARVEVCKDSFVLFVYYEKEHEGIWYDDVDWAESLMSLRAFFPSKSTWTTVCEEPGFVEYENFEEWVDGNGIDIINNKFIAVFENKSEVEHMWKLSGQIFKKFTHIKDVDCKINQSFTKLVCLRVNHGMSIGPREPFWSFHCLW